MRVLLFTARFGDGHQQVAAALHEAFQQRGVTTIEQDCHEATNRWLAAVSRRSYELATQFTPWLYGWSYHVTARFSIEHPFWDWLAVSTRKAALESVRTYRPDAVIQVFPDHALATKRPQGPRPFTAVVVTDYAVHPHWFHPAADAYFLPAEGLLPRARALAGPRPALWVSGIPVRPQFRERQDPPVQAQLPYIVVATGGRGVFFGLRDVLEALHHHFPDHRVYVMCGRNERMRMEIERLSSVLPRVAGLPFVENVASWFQHASFAVIKAGGLTVTECVVSRCPMVVYRPQPGQEEENARFMEQAGAARCAWRVPELMDHLEALKDPGARTAMAQACGRLARPHAADVIADQILTILRARRQGFGS
jgi:processive 1,2-diacylglycerol beta-glucosyltransferase